MKNTEFKKQLNKQLEVINKEKNKNYKCTSFAGDRLVLQIEDYEDWDGEHYLEEKLGYEKLEDYESIRFENDKGSVIFKINEEYFGYAGMEYMNGYIFNIFLYKLYKY